MHETKGFFQFEIIINVINDSLYKYFYSHSAGIGFRRQNLTFKVDPRAERVKQFSLYPLKAPW